MNNIWEKLKSTIRNIFGAKEEEKDYLTDLVNNLKEARKKHQNLPFRIESAKRKGFVVKVGGMFAFVPFSHMPWEYKTYEQWRAVSRHLVGLTFFCKIYSISENVSPVQIRINAESHIFKKTRLAEREQYEGVVIHRANYGLFVDLGYHFGWKYGSFVGLIHRSTYKNDDKLLGAELGEVIKTYFHGTKKQDGLILGNENVQKEWLTGELDNLIGTEQTAMLMEDGKGKKAFFVDGKYKTVVYADKDRFQNVKGIRKELKNLKMYGTVKCGILRISKENNFVSELLAIESGQQ